MRALMPRSSRPRRRARLEAGYGQLAEDDDLWRSVGMMAAVDREISAANESAVFELAADVLN